MTMRDRSVRRTHVFRECSLICVYITGAKGNYINNADLAGFAMWEAGGDTNNILLDAISLGSGIGC
jgi:hypothetical protein